MALKSTIFKAGLRIADMDRNYYADHALTIARHPSETDERMMVRVLAFAMHANAALAFANGISGDDEPDLWQRDLTDAILLWIDVGQPDEKLVRKACGRARDVVIYTFGRGADLWWNRAGPDLLRTRNLTVVGVPAATSQALARLARRTMQLQCTIQDGHVWLSDEEQTVEAPLTSVHTSAAGP
jgi:uncharacterized protein YaeQ